MRLLHAIFQRSHILPHEYAKLNYLERAFVRASTMAAIEEENNARK